jgi:hypothetical protein
MGHGRDLGHRPCGNAVVLFFEIRMSNPVTDRTSSYQRRSIFIA